MIDWIKIGCNEINPLALNEPWLLTSVTSQHLEYTMPHLAGFYFSWRFQMYLKMIFLNSDTWLRPLTCVLSPDEGRRFFFFAKGFTKITMNVNKASNLRHPECLNLAARLEQLERGSNLIVFVMVFMLGGKFREVQQKNGCVFGFFFFFFMSAQWCESSRHSLHSTNEELMNSSTCIERVSCSPKATLHVWPNAQKKKSSSEILAYSSD